jgi:hypothetical protein
MYARRVHASCQPLSGVALQMPAKKANIGLLGKPAGEAAEQPAV